MAILRIEHKIQSYEGWKKAFDSDPIGRQKSGVTGYRIYQPDFDPHYVIIDLEFEHAHQAQAMLQALKTLWKKVDGSVVFNPQVSILNIAEQVEY